jgi:hypothetical protein
MHTGIAYATARIAKSTSITYVSGRSGSQVLMQDSETVKTATTTY